MRRNPTIDDLLRDEAAFVHRIARALLRDAELAFDVAQDTLAAACEKPPQTTNRLGFRAFLRTIIKRLAQVAVQRRAERIRRERVVARPEATDAEGRATESLELHRMLVAAVEAMPEPYRTTIVLRFVRDLPPRAIALECKVTAGVVRQRLHRGLAMLRERLDRSPGGRPQWTGALLALGIPGTPAVSIVGALMTKKLLGIAAILSLTLGTWMLMPPATQGDAPEVTGPSANAEANVASVDDPLHKVDEPTASPSLRSSANLRVIVRDEAGRPVVGAAVHDCRSETHPVPVVCDAEGNASLPRASRAGEIVVLAEDHLPSWTKVEANAEHAVLTLKTGTSLTGLALVDGTAAPEGLELSLLLESSASTTDAPKSDTAQRLVTNEEMRTSRTQSGGAFAFANLPLDWRGTIVVPRTHWILRENGEPAAQARALDLLSTDRALTLRTTQLPSVTGRVLFDDGTPAEGAKVDAHALFDDQTYAEPATGLADRDGRFELVFVPQWSQHMARFADAAKRPRVARIHFMTGTLNSKRSDLDWRPPEARIALALPTVELRIVRMREVHFVCLDESSQPVEGARMLAQYVSLPTDENGRGLAHGTPVGVASPDSVVIPASAAVRGSGTQDDPIVFALRSARRWTVQVRMRDGELLRGCRLWLSGSGETMHDLLNAERNVLCQTAWGLPYPPQPRGDGTYLLNLPLDETGSARAPGLPANARCSLLVLDTMGSVLAEADIAQPQRTNERIDVIVQTPVTSLQGRVHCGGLAPRRAMVRANSSAGTPMASTPTLEDGSFAFECIRTGTPLEILVESEGFVPHRSRALAGDRLDLELQKGRSLVVSVVDGDDRLVPVQSVVAISFEDTNARPKLIDVGRYRFDDLPLEALSFRCTLGGRTFDFAAEDRADAAKLRLADLAVLRVTGPVANEALAGQCIEPEGRPFHAMPHTGVCRLPPGRYRFDHATPNEVILRAGETVEVTLH